MNEPAAIRTPRSWFIGRSFAFAGRLQSLSHEEASRLIEGLGGEVTDRVTRQTDGLVVGTFEFGSDKKASAKVDRARSLIEDGHSIELLDEPTLRHRLGHDDVAHRGYTIRQLSRISRISEPRLRSWVQRGVLRPTRQLGRVPLFEFEDASTLRKLGEMLQHGHDPKHILQDIRRAESWWSAEVAEGDRVLDRLVEKDGDLLVRLNDELLSEPTGQLRLPMDGSQTARIETLFGGDAAPLGSEPQSDDPERWFEHGVECEARESWPDAVHAYQRALELGSRAPEVAFNLGNVEQVRGDIGRALDAYLQALDFDPEFVEAWNNIGNVFSEHGRTDDAINAYNRALELSPEYPDAHFNLAELHLSLGDRDAAWQHAFLYFKHDSQSEWARRLLQRFQ